MTDESMSMILWTVVGAGAFAFAFSLGLAYFIGGATKLGGSQDVPAPDCQHDIPWHSCFVCLSADAKRHEERHG